MAGQGGDEGSSKQLAALKGKDPVSPSGDNISIDAHLPDPVPEETHEVAAEDNKDRGKGVMTDEEIAALAAKEKASPDLMNQVRALVAILPTAHPGVEDTGTGKRAGDQSGPSEAKKPRKAGGSPTRRGNTGGFVADPAGIDFESVQSIIDEPRFLKNAMSSAFDKGFYPLYGPPNVYLPQPGVLCKKCHAAAAVTNFYSSTQPEHICLCVPCVYDVATGVPTEVPCGICKQEAIDRFYNN